MRRFTPEDVTAWRAIHSRSRACSPLGPDGTVRPHTSHLAIIWLSEQSRDGPGNTV